MPGDNVGVGARAEHFAVVELGRQIAAPEAWSGELDQACWTQREFNQIGLDGPVEESIREFVENARSIQRVIRGGKAAAGYR